MEIHQIEIIKVLPADVEKLQSISKLTFLETFAADNDETNMQKYLEKNLSLEKLTSEINHPDSEFYFALSANRIMGYLKINRGNAQTEIRDSNSIEIERIYVIKKFHGKKIGQILYDKALQIAEQAGAEYIWLGVWGKNLRAINFYKKNGFVEFDKHIFKLGEDEQTDILMKLELRKM